MTEFELIISALIISIVGLIITTIALIITIYIKKDTAKMKKNQINNAQLPYQQRTYENINKINYFYRKILSLLSYQMNSDLILEEETHEELIVINTKLFHFFQKYKMEMNQLAKTTDLDLRSWVDVNKEGHIEFRKIITNYNWMTEKFFLEDKREEDQIRNWQRYASDIGSCKEHLEETMKEYDYLFSEKD